MLHVRVDYYYVTVLKIQDLKYDLNNERYTYIKMLLYQNEQWVFGIEENSRGAKLF